jgi:hypothetical protein
MFSPSDLKLAVAVNPVDYLTRVLNRVPAGIAQCAVLLRFVHPNQLPRVLTSALNTRAVDSFTPCLTSLELLAGAYSERQHGVHVWGVVRVQIHAYKLNVMHFDVPLEFTPGSQLD